MRLAVITPFPPLKYAEADHGLRLCQHLAKAGVEVHALTTGDSVSVAAPNLTVWPTMRDWSWRDWPRMRTFLRTVAPDAVLLFYFGPMYNGHPMITFAPTLSKGALPGVPFVTQFSHPGGFQPSRTPWADRIFRKACVVPWAGAGVDYLYGTLFRDSDRMVVFSEPHRVTLAQLSPRVNDKSVLIPPPPFLRMAEGPSATHRERVNRQFGFAEDDFVLSYFGYIYLSKGIETLLRAFRLALDRRPNLRLLLVGGTPDDTPNRAEYLDGLKRLASELAVGDRVTFTGDYPWDSDIGSSYLRATDACVLPFDKGVRLNNSSFAAAASHGLPIVSTCGDEIEEAFIDERNVLFCPPKNVEAMAAAISRVVEDAALRDRLRDGVRLMADEWFSWDRAVEKTIATMRFDAEPRFAAGLPARSDSPA